MSSNDATPPASGPAMSCQEDPRRSGGMVPVVGILESVVDALVNGRASHRESRRLFSSTMEQVVVSL